MNPDDGLGDVLERIHEALLELLDEQRQTNADLESIDGQLEAIYQAIPPDSSESIERWLGMIYQAMPLED